VAWPPRYVTEAVEFVSNSLVDYLRHASRYFCALILAAPTCLAQVSQFEGLPIIDIRFSPSQPLDPQDLAHALPLKKGEPLHSEDVARAIDSLFATGQFEDIMVDAEPSGAGVLIRFVVRNTWFVGGVSVEGKTPFPPNRGQIATAAQLNLGVPFHDADVTNAVHSIQHLLEANGLYQAQVEPSVERDNKAQQVFVTFTVKVGKRAKYAEPVIQGQTRLSDATILRATGWRLPIIHWWRQVTDSRTREGVQGLLSKYAKQDRLRATVEIKNLDYDAQHRRVHPHLDVDPGPQVKLTAVETKVSKSKLKKYVPIYQEGTVDNDLLMEGKRNLQDYFQNQGYYDAEVEFRQLPPQDDLERIEYVISRGQRFKMAHLTLSGNKYFDTETIRERMFIAPASLRLRHGRYSEAFRRKDEENITNLYRANGFRDVKVVSSVERDYRGKPGDVAMTVNVQEGPQWLVEHLDIHGVAQIDLKDLTTDLASSSGQPFSDVEIARDRDYLLTYYFSHGFPGAQFNSSWQVDGTPNHVNLVYDIKEGDRQYVRDVLTSGLRTTRPSEVNRQITLHPGDPLSPIQQTNIQKQLYDLDIFARVDTAIENPDGDTDHKYVLYNFEEANRYTFAVGVGAQVARFGTPSTASLGSPAGTTGFSPEFSLEVSRLNFLGLGHTVTAQGVFSNIEKRASLSYLQPRVRNVSGQNLTYTVLFDNTLDVRTFAAKREEGSIQLSERFSKSLTGLFRFAYRRVSVSSVVIPVLLIPQLVQPVRIGMLSGSLVQDRRDNPADPHHGMYNTADIGVSGSFFGSQRQFARVLLRNATYYPLTKHLILARQTQFGVIQPFSPPAGISAQESIPLPERFFSGGADSLRSFGYNEAGPRDTGVPLAAGEPASAPTGFPLGGNALFINNVELRFPFLWQNMQGVLFHDLGNVYSSLSDISLRFNQKNLQDFNYAVQDVGLGLRYKTPVGPIRVDLAYAINPPNFIGFKGTPLQLLQCGPNAPPVGACQPVQQNTGHIQFFFSIGQTF
jgi:outer membrane protein insertion porin family